MATARPRGTRGARTSSRRWGSRPIRDPTCWRSASSSSISPSCLPRGSIRACGRSPRCVASSRSGRCSTWWGRCATRPLRRISSWARRIESRADLMAEVLARMPQVRRAAVVTGCDGLDEVTLDGPTRVLAHRIGPDPRRELPIRRISACLVKPRRASALTGPRPVPSESAAPSPASRGRCATTCWPTRPWRSGWSNNAPCARELARAAAAIDSR